MKIFRRVYIVRKPVYKGAPCGGNYSCRKISFNWTTSPLLPVVNFCTPNNRRKEIWCQNMSMWNQRKDWWRLRHFSIQQFPSRLSVIGSSKAWPSRRFRSKPSLSASGVSPARSITPGFRSTWTAISSVKNAGFLKVFRKIWSSVPPLLPGAVRACFRVHQYISRC